VRRPIDLATAAVNWTVSFFAGLAAAALLLMVLVTVGNIGLRVAATPYNGTYEIVGMLSVLVSGLALAEAQRHKTHIAIDLVMSRRSVRVQLLVGAVVTAVSAVMFALVVVMTMFSAMMFDPRLLWDREPDPSHEEMQQHGK